MSKIWCGKTDWSQYSWILYNILYLFQHLQSTRMIFGRQGGYHRWISSIHLLVLGRPCYISVLCLLQNPALTAWLGHPACVQGLTCAPCKIQTPPFLACLVHPSWLQIYLYGVAPFLTQTPPFFAILVHPSWLQVFADARFAPCLIHTPSLMDWFVHPSWLQIFTLAPCLLQTPPVIQNKYLEQKKRGNTICVIFVFTSERYVVRVSSLKFCAFV